MEFLQRHLPRVYQAVQSALDYITNMTAQIFGAPPNAPQPGDARTRTPLQSQDAATKSQGTDEMTLATDVSSEEAALEATEESMTIYGIQQDVESQAQEMAVRYRKENVERRHLDYHHTISDANDTFNHQDESHRKTTNTDDQEPPKPKGVEDISCKVVTEILHAEVHQVINEDVQKVNLEALMSEEQTRNKTENKSISRLEYLLRDLETNNYQEPEVSPTGDQVPKSILDFEIEENSCSNVNVSPNLGKTITIQEISEEAPICQLTVTLEEVDQEPPEDVLATPLIMDYDDLDVPDIKRQHKKLVTPVSAEDKSPSDQGEEARKTWEHLQETAVRLAMQCDLFQDKDQESEALESGDMPKNTHEDKISVSRLNKQVDSEEYQENTSHDQKEVKELSSEEKEHSEEVSSVSTLGEGCQPAEQGQRIEKMRRRVHFSPSVEEREQMSADIVCIKWTHEPMTELTDHPSNLHPRPESGELPIDKEGDFEFISSNQVIEPSMIDQNTEHDQVKPLNPGSTVWYDELEMSTHTNEETCKSIDDVTYQSVTLGFQSEEVTNVFPDEKSLEELFNDIPTVEEMSDGEEEQNKYSMAALHDSLTHSEVDCEVEYDREEGTQRFDKIDGPLEKSYEVVSDLSNQEVSNFTELKVTVSLEVESPSSEEIKVDLLLQEDAESMKQQVHAEVDSEDNDSKEKLLQLSCSPLVEEDSTEGGITPMTQELNSHESRLKDRPDGASEPTVSVYTPDEENIQTSVQELDTSKTDQLQDEIITTESERRLSVDSSNIDNVQTAEHSSEEGSEGSAGRNRPMTTETQNEEDMSGKEYHNVDVLSQIKPQSEQVEGHMRVKTESQMEEMDDYMWYKQESYQNDGLIIYSGSFEEPGSQKDPTEKAEESSEQLLSEECEVNSKDGVGGQSSQKFIGSHENATKDIDLHIVSETEPRNQSLSRYTENAFGSDSELEGICRYAETGFDLLSGIHSVINTSQSEQDVSEVIKRSEITHCVSADGHFLEDTTESKLQIDNVKDLDLQCIITEGHPVAKTSEDLLGENKSSLTSDETLGDQSLEIVKEVEISFDTGTLNRSEVILDQHFLSELHSVIQSLDHPAEVLEIMSTMNVGQSDKGVDYVAHANEETLEHENTEERSSDLHLSEELGSQIESVQTFEEDDYSSICIASTETMIEVSDINLDTNNTLVEISENKEDGKAGEDQSSVILDETSNGHLGDQILDSVKELEILLETGSPAEDNNEVIMGSISETYSGTVEERDDHLSSMKTSVEMIVSTINQGHSDKEVEDVRCSNEETIAEIFLEEISSDHENSEEHIPGFHLSEELGSLIELKQIFKEEDYSSMGMVVNESIIESSDIGSDTHNTPVEILEISENKKEDAEKDHSFVTVDETSNRLLGDQILDRVKEPEILLESGSPAEDNTEVVVGSMLYSEKLEGGDDLLSNMYPSEEVNESPMNVEVSDKWLKGEGQSDDPTIVDIFSETLENQEKHMENYPEMFFSSKLGSIIDLEHSWEEHRYSSIIVSKTQVEATEFNNYLTETENVLSKEIDPSSEIYNDLIPDHTVETTSESKGESQSYKTVDDTFRKQFGNLEVHEPVIHTETGSVAEYIDIISESTSEYSLEEGVLLSDLHTVKMTDHQIDAIGVVSSTGKEDILDARKAHEILVESTIPVDIISDNVIPDEQGKNKIDTSEICHVEEIGSSFEPSQEPEENQPNSSSPIFIEESHIGLGIVNTAEENVIVPLEDYEPKEMDLLSEIQSVITSDYSVEASTSMSTVAVVEVAEDFFTKSIAPEQNEDSEENHQKLGSSEPGKDLEKKVHEQDASQPTLSIITHHSEDITSIDINEFTKTEDFGSSDLEIRLPSSVDLIKPEAVEGEEQISSKEALCSDPNKQVITIPTDKPIKVIEPPTHMEVNEDQEKPLVDHKGTIKEPSLEEDDDIDSSLFPHNMLDISAQKSRVQLRRKTSIRRKQGQQQGPSESEPVEPPKPIPRPWPMGVPIFPGNMPIFPMVPARTPGISHTTEEQKEEGSAEAEATLIKPKKGIPRHAGFGIPHPQMMQELQSRLKKKKPNE